ncbi:MAG: hypothetical protein RL761_180, partial [Pseudomonadota bacterium]
MSNLYVKVCSAVGFAAVLGACAP